LPGPEVRFPVFEPVLAEPVTELRAAIEEPVPSAAPAPHVYTTRAYWLQITIADHLGEAGRLASRLHDGKPSVRLERTTENDQPRVRVRIGPFQDATEAVLELLALQGKGHDAYLIAERE